jgi:hypothetical protein
MELGIISLSDLTADPHTGRPVSALHPLDATLAYARTADELGLDVFALGEHHSHKFAVASPAVVLATIAAQTERIRLTSGVTVLSALDPVRVDQSTVRRRRRAQQVPGGSGRRVAGLVPASGEGLDGDGGGALLRVRLAPRPLTRQREPWAANVPAAGRFTVRRLTEPSRRAQTRGATGNASGWWVGQNPSVCSN